MKIMESAENYLESILKIYQKKGVVRSIDVVNDLGFKKSSISVAMKQLRENGYIDMATDGEITLTENGLTIATDVFERHILLKNALVAIGVPEDIAEVDACKIEHDLSEEAFTCLKRYISDRSLG